MVITAYITTFAYIPELFSSPNIVLFLLAGVLYIIIGIFGESYVEKQKSLAIKLIYFLIQITIGGIIAFLSKGAAWLALLPLASHSITLLPRWGIFVISSALLTILVLQGYLITENIQEIAPSFVSLLAAIIFVAVFTQITVSEQNTRMEMERLATQLSQANEQLREYALRAEELAAADERNRIAREIHDGLGHYLTALNMQLKASQAIFEQNPTKAYESLSKAQTLAQEALSDVRRSVSALRANPANQKPLPEALRELIEDKSFSELETIFIQSGQAFSLSPQAELALFRSAQEGLTNIHKHAQATQAEFHIHYSNDSVTLTIKDNGRGVDQLGKGYGLLGLKERLRLLGGDIETMTSPSDGFILKVSLPIQKKEPRL